MARERHDDYQGFSTWVVGLMRKNGYALDGPRAGGQTRLSALSGVSNTVISHIINGRRIPDVQTMVKLAPHLGTTVREMLLHSGRVLEEDLVPSVGNPLIDPVLDRIYAMDYLPIEVRKARADDYLRRVEDARRLAEAELADDMQRHESAGGESVRNGT